MNVRTSMLSGAYPGRTSALPGESVYMNVPDFMRQICASVRLCLKHYRGSECFRSQSRSIEGKKDIFSWAETDRAWRLTWEARPAGAECFDITLVFRADRDVPEESAFGIEFHFERWSTDHYVLMPAAAYNGNRFRSKPLKYPPLVQDSEDRGPDAPIVITDVPRLNIDAGPSRIQLLTRDMSTPSIGFYAPALQKGFWLLTEQKTSLGDSGITIEESPDRTQAVITLTAPGVRERVCFSHSEGMARPSPDRGAVFKAGQELELKARFYVFDCPKVQTLFDTFVLIRKEVTGPARLRHELPFSAAWRMLEAKHNEQNWNESDGHYKVGVLDRINDDWQLGWVGGIISTYPMLAEGSALSRRRALETFDFLFRTQTACGFFPGIYSNGKAYGDGFNTPGTDHWHLVRKSADALYFMLKQFRLLETQKASNEIAPAWTTGTRKLADAFVRLWEDEGQFGQFVDVNTGRLLVGGSTGAAIAPAGLALAHVYYQEPKYLDVAMKAASAYYFRDVQAGVTTGGPGEIAKCPDSESAFGLLESLVVLYEITHDPVWLARAQEMAAQCFTWCVSYNFEFPENSSFGKLRMRSGGSVWASVQNKHAAPGICTLSGDSLFKLYRATGKTDYLELIREIAHNHTQYLSRKDRPVSMIPAGWMNERVELSDWAEPTGEISPESSWCEVSCMLTYLEIPGIYVRRDTGCVTVFDNVDAELIKNGPADTLKISNPTAFDAEVKILAETDAEARRPLGQKVVLDCQRISVPAGGRVYMEL